MRIAYADPATQPELLTVRELASYLRIGMRTAYLYVTEGTVPAVKVGGQWRIPRAELDRQLGKHAGPPAAPPRPPESDRGRLMPNPTPERAEALRLAHDWDKAMSPTIAAQQQAAMTVTVDAIQKLARAFLAAESERAELAREVERLRSFSNMGGWGAAERAARAADENFARAERAEREVEELRGALRFYADRDKYLWSSGPPPKRGVIQAEDRGAVARAALSEPTEGK